MRRLTRYGLSLFIAGLITALAATSTDSVLLLVGIGQVYAVGSAIVLRSELRRIAMTSGSTPDSIFVGVTVFSALTIAQTLSTEFHYGAAIFTFGVGYFSFFCGIWPIVELDV